MNRLPRLLLTRPGEWLAAMTGQGDWGVTHPRRVQTEMQEGTSCRGFGGVPQLLDYPPMNGGQRVDETQLRVFQAWNTGFIDRGLTTVHKLSPPYILNPPQKALYYVCRIGL